MEGVLRVTCVLAGVTTRWYAYVFLRHLPYAKLYLGTILTASSVFLASALALRNGKSRGPLGRSLVLLSGVPDRSHRALSVLSAVITLLCPIACLDMVYRNHLLHPATALEFSRTGWVTESSARLLLRSIGDQSLDLAYWPVNGSSVRHVSVDAPGPQTDYTSAIVLSGLSPLTTYVYNTSRHSGSFVTSRTDADLDSFSILSTSCQKPGWPYSPLDSGLRIRGLEHVDRYAAKSNPEAMLFLGDFIYSDLPMQLAPYTTPYYRKLYRQVYASPSWTPILRTLPFIHMFDDHEFLNDFAASNRDHAPLYPEGIDPFKHYQSSVNPPPLEPTEPTYTSFHIGKVAFFLMDNRSYRDPQPERPGSNSTAGFGPQSLMGERQLQHYREWVKRENAAGRLLVLVSGVPMTRNWSEGKDEMDFWSGYLDERDIVLEELWAVGGGIVISGDRHEHATTLLPPPAGSYPFSSAVIEFSTSPLSFFHNPFRREYVPHPPTDLPVHYQFKGASKFGVFEFDTPGDQRGCKFKLVIDGEETWEMEWWKGKEVTLPKEWRAKEGYIVDGF